MKEMYVLKVCVYIAFLCCVPYVSSNNRIQNERLCADPECSVPISHAKAEIKYVSPMDGVLSFKAGQLMTVYSKTTPEDTKLKRGLWGVEINGKRGYVPPTLIREFKVLTKDVNHVVPTEFGNTEVDIESSQNIVPGQEISLGVNAELGDGGPPSTPFTVVEGTTVYLGVDGEKVIEPSATQDPTLKTEALEPSSSNDQSDDQSKVANNKIDAVAPDHSNINETDTTNNDGDVEGDDVDDEEEDDEEEESEEDAETNEPLLESVKIDVNLSENPGAPKIDVTSLEPVLDDTIVNSPLEQEKVSRDQIAEGAESPEPEAAAPKLESLPSAEVVSPLQLQQETASASHQPLHAPTATEEPSPQSQILPDVVVHTGAPVEFITQLPTVPKQEITESSASSVDLQESVTLQPITNTPESFLAEEALEVNSTESTHTFLPSPDSATERIEQVPEMTIRPPILGALPPVYPGLFPSPTVAPQDPVYVDKVLQPADLPEIPVEHVGSETVSTPANRPEADSAPPVESIVQNLVINHEEQLEAIIEEPKPISPPEVQEPVTVFSESVSESEGFLSGLTGMFSGMFGSDTTPNDYTEPEVVTPPADPVPEIFTSDDSFIENVVPAGQCKSIEGLESDCEDAPSPSYLFEFFDRKNSGTTYTFVYLVVTAITVLVFTLGHYFIERNRQDGPLIAKVNQLTRELQVASAQLESRSYKESSSLAEINNEVLVALQAEVEDLKRIKSEQEAQLEAQQQELESATEAGLELNRMLSDLLTQKNGPDNLLLSVEHLQGQLDSQQKIIDDMNRSLTEKSAENDALQVDLATALEKAETLDEELSEMRENLNMHLREKEEVTQLLETQNGKLEGEVAVLRKAADEVTARLAVRESEFTALSQTIDQLQTKDVDTKALYDVGAIKAELTRVQAERDTLQERLSDEEGARRLLEDHMKAVDEEVSRLRVASDAAEKEKVDAQTRLTVLSNYFKEKETQLQKELGLQEAMWVQKQGDETTVFERIKSLQEEVDNYKSQNETLKKEILDQERGLKGQIATLEKKAHENWVAARQAERRLEESKQEAGQLRNMLTLMEKSHVSETDGKAPTRVSGELNGDEPPLVIDATSPLPFPPHLPPMDPHHMLPPGFMPPLSFMPPPPSGFIPPPPFMPGDRRPAPLGRMSSPPLNRFSPGPSEYDDYDRLSPPPLSPPIRNYRSPPGEGDRFRHRTPPSPSFPSRQWDEPPHRAAFRPVAPPRDSRRDFEGSNISSGHSSNESLDKPSRMKV